MKKMRSTQLLQSAGVAALALAVAACAGGSPTAPPNTLPQSTFPATSTAVIAGAVTSVPTGVSPAGILVRIDAPRLETRTDSAGSFRLEGVQPGNRVLVFETSSISAALALGTVSAGQSLQIAVALSSSGASFDDGGGHGADDPAGDDNGGQGADDPAGDDNGGHGADDNGVDSLQVDFNPSQWPADGAVGRHRITARIEGLGFDRINRSSVVLVGAAGTANPIGSSLEVDELEVDFAPDAALAAVGNPAPGTVVDVAVRFDLDGQSVTLHNVVTIVAASSSGGHG